MTQSTQSPGAMSLELASRLPGLEIVQGLLNGQVPPPPFAEITNVTPTLVERGRVTFEGTPSAQFNNHIGVTHGGWASLLLDTTMGCAVHTMLDAGYAYSTIALNVAFIKPVRALGAIRCEAIRCTPAGARLQPRAACSTARGIWSRMGRRHFSFLKQVLPELPAGMTDDDPIMEKLLSRFP